MNSFQGIQHSLLLLTLCLSDIHMVRFSAPLQQCKIHPLEKHSKILKHA